MNFALHAGLPKTATTTLQNALFARHPEIYYLGKSALGDRRRLKGCRSEDLYQALKPILWSNRGQIDPGALMTALHRDPSFSDPAKKIVLGSWEGLARNKNERRFLESMHRLKASVGNFRFIITLRNPLQWVPSLYLQHLNGHFVNGDRPRIGSRTYVDFDTWFHLDPAGASEIFAYGKNVQHALDELGKHNVGVFVFEEFVADPVDFAQRLCQFLDIDGTPSRQLLADRHLNPRTTEGQTRLMRETQRSWLRRTIWRFSSATARRRALRKTSVDEDTNARPARIELTDEARERIIHQSASINRWLSSEFGLSLERHGYPMT